MQSLSENKGSVEEQDEKYSQETEQKHDRCLNLSLELHVKRPDLVRYVSVMVRERRLVSQAQGLLGVLNVRTMTSGSMKMARSRTQLTTAQAVCKANVSIHLVRSDSKLSQLAEGVVPQARISRRRNATVQRVTKTMSVQLATSKAVMPERPVRGADVT
jgi:acid phosphatase class B